MRQCNNNITVFCGYVDTDQPVELRFRIYHLNKSDVAVLFRTCFCFWPNQTKVMWIQRD